MRVGERERPASGRERQDDPAHDVEGSLGCCRLGERPASGPVPVEQDGLQRARRCVGGVGRRVGQLAQVAQPVAQRLDLRVGQVVVGVHLVGEVEHLCTTERAEELTRLRLEVEQRREAVERHVRVKTGDLVQRGPHRDVGRERGVSAESAALDPRRHLGGPEPLLVTTGSDRLRERRGRRRVPPAPHGDHGALHVRQLGDVRQRQREGVEDRRHSSSLHQNR